MRKAIETEKKRIELLAQIEQEQINQLQEKIEREKRKELLKQIQEQKRMLLEQEIAEEQENQESFYRSRL